MVRVGVDVGGTFTDFVLFDDVAGALYYFKEPSTSQDPSQAIRNGLSQALQKYELKPDQIGFVGHGTTLGTNMVIERRTAKTGLITTKGFRDVLEIGRQMRPNVYDYKIVKPVPIAARQHRIEVSERMDVHGNVLVDLDEAELSSGLDALKEQGIEAVAICYLHSYLFPDHEKRTEALVREMLPDVFVSRSSDVLPEFREYERFSTTTINASLGPKLREYLDRLVEHLQEIGVSAAPYTIHSNGGLMSIPTVRRYPVRTCLSGPAAGVIGAACLAHDAGIPDTITFDVGGTSTDVSLIHGGRPQFTTKREVADYPVKTPMVDIHVIGAGGGSIAYVEDAGALRVGPRSAGAKPGPAAYMRGGTEPTLTDANVVLGRLNPKALLNGAMPVDYDGAWRVIEEKVAKPLGMDVETAAYGILRIATSNMARAIRAVSTERGLDLGAFTLLAYGGAGPLHAVETALECGMERVLIPQEPGTLCARGILTSDISLDFVQSHILPFEDEIWPDVLNQLGELRKQAEAWLEQEEIPADKRVYKYVLEARYDGQNHEVKVEMPGQELTARAFLAAFEEAHRTEYGYALSDRAIELVNFRVRAVARVPRATGKAYSGTKSLDEAEKANRDIYVNPSDGWVSATVYARSKLPPNRPIPGPAIIEEMSSTSVILPGQTGIVDDFGNLVVNLRGLDDA